MKHHLVVNFTNAPILKVHCRKNKLKVSILYIMAEMMEISSRDTTQEHVTCQTAAG